MKITADKAKALAILAGTAAALYVGYRLWKGVGDAKDRIGKVFTEDLNPASNQNLIYRGVNTITGGDNADSSPGTRIYDFFHPNE